MSTTITPATLSSRQTAALLGVGHSTVQRAGVRGALTIGTTDVHPIRVGARVLWPAAPIRAALGLDEEAAR